MKRILVAATLALATVAGIARAAQPVPYLPVPAGSAVILNTGSTNAPGYRIVVRRNGTAEYVKGSNRAVASIGPALTAKFFTDLSHAMPLSKLRVLACMKSASFGTETYVWWRGQRSPDLSCPDQASAVALADDVASIATALQLTGSHLIQPLPNEPRKPLPMSSPKM